MQETERGYEARGYRAICAEIRRRIENGHLKPGDRIPSETEMAMQFKVSKMTAARARQELSMLGVIHAVPGIGSFVAGKAKPLTRLPGSNKEIGKVPGLTNQTVRGFRRRRQAPISSSAGSG